MDPKSTLSKDQHSQEEFVRPPIEAKKSRWGLLGKTVWDWLQLLVVPLMLALITVVFTWQQNVRQNELEDQRARQAQKIEDQRAEAERELAVQRAQDEALQAYLDQMSNLLLERNLRESEEDSEVRTLARARTLTVLERLDPSRKTALMQFLVEADLVRRVDGRDPIIGLSFADLSGADLSGGTDLRRAVLRFADLSDADLSIADLSGADLSDADLSRADLSDAVLFVANLSYADLSGANLRRAVLDEADLYDANLSGADLSRAFLINADLPFADLSGADLSRADLSGDAVLRGADLSRADLSGANLRRADLSGADLSGADLSGADLSGADGVTKEGLEQQTESLEGTIMPAGTIYPGRYAARKFEPAVSFSVSDGWRLSFPRRPAPTGRQVTTDELSIEGPEGGQLFFTNPRHVYDPSNPSAPKKLPAPENAKEWVSWFQRHPNLDTSKPVPASVGDASGKRIDVTVTSTPENYPQEVCGEEPCVPFYTVYWGFTSEYTFVGSERFKDRFVIVDVGNETVLIDVAAPTDKFDEFLPKAQKVLDSVVWKGENSGPS